MPKQQWFKFWVSDWRADPKLRMCSIGARGLWFEMICLMHESDPYGHLLIGSDQPSNAQLANLVGIQVGELAPLIEELERHGVFSRRNNGTIYSRKMAKLKAVSDKARANGAQGGNPVLLKRPKAKTATPRDTTFTVSFSAFWDIWPNKVQKKAAQNAWKKLNEKDRQAATGTLQSWWDLWRRRHPDAAPIHASTYLNGRRWEDDFGGTSAQMDPDIQRWAAMT